MLRSISSQSTANPSSSSSSAPSPEDSGIAEEISPRSSRTVNLALEYTLAVQTNSYNEIWSKIHIEYAEEYESELVAQVLQPSRELVEGALRLAKPSNLTRFAQRYFENSENTAHLCSLLLRCVYRARSLYAPLHDLIDVLPVDSLLTQPQCDSVFDVFLKFDCLDNPFPNPDSDNFDEMRRCFSHLKQQLDLHLHKARKRVGFHRGATTGAAVCLVGIAVGVALCAVAIATHALVALVAGPLAFLPPNFAKKQLVRISQLDAATKGTYVLNNDLDTIDRLVKGLHSAVESDKVLIRFGLDRGRDRYPIREVVKQLRKKQPNFLHQLKDLEEHVCLCFTTVNRARSLLLEEIHLHQTRNS